MTRIRNAFRTIASGITKATRTILRHGLSRKRWEATRLVMKSTQLEWIPLHSWAIFRTIPGSMNTVPSRTSGVPVILKNKAETSAEASTEAVSSRFTAASGSGTMKIRNATGKAAAAIHFEPRNRNPPAATTLT